MNDSLLRISDFATQNHLADKEINIKVRESSNNLSKLSKLNLSNEEIFYSKHTLFDGNNNVFIEDKNSSFPKRFQISDSPNQYVM